MLDRTIVKVLVCLMVSLASAPARAQGEASEPAQDDGRASVELSLSVAPQLVLAGASGLGGLGGLGNAGSPLPVGLDIAFALVPTTLLAIGISANVNDMQSFSSWNVQVPLSLLFYLDTPRVGAVLPTVRVGGILGYSSLTAESLRSQMLSGHLLVRGGITWLALRCLALRAEIGVDGGVTAALSEGSTWGSLGLDASVAVVLRI